MLTAFFIGALLASPVVFQQLPSDASAPGHCPAPPKTISTQSGRIYECRPEEGSSPYYDVTPPDERTHWRLPFGNPQPPPAGTASYHPAKNWPFRAILVVGNSARRGEAPTFYTFDKDGMIKDSNVFNAVGDQLMEVRVSGVRLWPTARVFYRMIPPTKLVSAVERARGLGRVSFTDQYAFIVENNILCPALDEANIGAWSDGGASPGARGTYIYGHCGEAGGSDASTGEEIGSDLMSYGYPGFTDAGPYMFWKLQLHSDPEQPLTYKGQCYAFCVK